VDCSVVIKIKGGFMREGGIYVQGLCTNCNKNKQRSSGKIRGKTVYKRLCDRCHRKKYGIKKYRSLGYARHKKSSCEQCGFIPVQSCQLDVDHIDGDHSNSDPANLQTLCANCHRLKTLVNKDYLS